MIMKKIIFALSVIFSSVTMAQESNEITWFGLDFSKARLIGAIGFSDPAQIQSYYFNTWNSVIVTENEKYNISKYYKKPTLKTNLDIAKARNSKVVASSLVTDNNYTITEKDVEAVVKNYKSKNGGEGLVFVVESLSKTDELAHIYVVRFDAMTGKVLEVKKQTGKA
jgi:hypothetical protein